MKDVFISYRTSDEAHAQALYSFLRSEGLEVYIDSADAQLAAAVQSENNDQQVVDAIERGVRQSRFILAVVSSESKGSWWVPYELGFGRSLGKGLAFAAIEHVDNVPSFLKISDEILDQMDLRNWVARVKNQIELRESRRFDHRDPGMTKTASEQVTGLPPVRRRINYL